MSNFPPQLTSDQIVQQEIYQAVYNIVAKLMQLPEYRNMRVEDAANAINAQIQENYPATYHVVIDSLHAIMR